MVWEHRAHGRACWTQIDSCRYHRLRLSSVQLFRGISGCPYYDRSSFVCFEAFRDAFWLVFG
jgi:hypothetical protein